MKKTIICLLALVAISLSACSHENKPIVWEQLPQNAQTFINTYFKNLTVSNILKDKSEYEVYFTNGTQVEFDRHGEWTDVDCKTNPIPHGIVPIIETYVLNHFPQNYIVEVSRDNRGYDVELNNGLDLIFSKDFEFIRLDD